MNKNNNNFDKQLSDRLSSEELPFDPQAWSRLEEKLDNVPKGFFFRRFKLPYFLTFAGLLIIAIIYYWPHHYSNTNNNPARNNISAEQFINDQIKTSGIIATEESSSSSHNSDNKEKGKGAQLRTTDVINSQNTNVVFESSIKEDLIVRGGNRIASSSSDNKYLIATDIKSDSTEASKNNFSHNVPNSRKLSAFEVTGLSATASITSTGVLRNKNLLNGIAPLINERTTLFSARSVIDLDLQLIEIDENIIWPQGQLNFSFGGGMTKLESLEADSDTLSPVSVINHEAFISLSYLHRIRRHWGVEAGIRGSFQTKKLAYYFQPGIFDIQEPVFAKVNATNLEGKYELFTNVHFFLPLSQRSELDFHIGYFSMNPLETSGTSGSGSSFILSENENVSILGTDFRRHSGPFKSTRLNVGLNYNFITNRRNSVGIGIAYMHQLNGDVEGNYHMFQTSDFTQASGRIRENGSGFKVQFTYGFGMGDDLSQGLFKKKRIENTLPWYMGMRYGQKLYLFSDQLSTELISGNPNQYGTFFIGHYISQKMAFEVGLEYYEFNFSTPTELVISPTSFGMRKQSVLSVPFALRYDIYQANRFAFYGKGVFSTDFRLNQYNAYTNRNRGAVTDDSRLRLNAGLETGIDFRILEGINFGIHAKYNKAFSRLAVYQYPVTFVENEFELQDINLNNNYFSWGLELKYVFGR